MQTFVNLTSPIFDTARVHAELTNVVGKTAKEFKETTRRRMVESSASGVNYEKRSGRGFTRFHRASARGQRPAPDTLTLVNALQDNRVGDLTVEVFVDHRTNPENGEDAAVYAERLQSQMDRPIMSSDDARLAGIVLAYNAETAIAKLI